MRCVYNSAVTRREPPPEKYLLFLVSLIHYISLLRDSSHVIIPARRLGPVPPSPTTCVTSETKDIEDTSTLAVTTPYTSA